MAIFIEKEHLRDAEESDYMLMENLIQRRYDEEGANAQNSTFLTVIRDGRGSPMTVSVRALRRASAIEDDITTTQPSTSARQNSDESQLSTDITPLMGGIMPPRPSIVIDSLPVQREVVRRVSSKESLHMQSETMC